MADSEVYVELTEDVERIGVYFKYSPGDTDRIKSIKGYRFHDPRKKDPHTIKKPYWSVPLDLRSARGLRTVFLERMKLGPAFRAWAKQQVQLERNLRSLHTADDAELERVPHQIRKVIDGHPCPEFKLPKRHALSKKRPARPYQRADIRMMALSNAMNCNEVGTGKTLESIAAVYEAGLDGLPVLVIAPRRTLVPVWQTEFERLSDYAFMTSEDPRERAGCRNYVAMEYTDGNRKNSGNPPLALGVIPDDLRLERYYLVKDQPVDEDPLHACKDYKGNWYRFKSIEQQWLYEVEWGVVVCDEFHNTGINTRKSLFFNSFRLLHWKRVLLNSATPMGGKARRLWAPLHVLDPKEYTSEWAWIDQWLEVEEEEFYVRGQRRTSKSVGGIRPEVEDDFYRHHSKHMTRRLKIEALPGLPVAVEILVETPMTKKQRKVYDEFDKNHEVILSTGQRVSGGIVLAQYTRLRTFANAAESQSGKLEPLLERLDENGIRKGVKGEESEATSYEPGARAYIGCQEIAMVDLVAKVLTKNGIKCDIFTGRTKPWEAKRILKRFESDDEQPYVIVMTTKTGGTGLNLGEANSAHLIDEPWDPDIEYQFFGRGDRGSRDTPLRCYTYRTPNSIQEYVAAVAEGKKLTNATVLRYAKDIERMRRERA